MYTNFNQVLKYYQEKLKRKDLKNRDHMVTFSVNYEQWYKFCLAAAFVKTDPVEVLKWMVKTVASDPEITKVIQKYVK